jgi:hypothetical protein
MSRQTQIIFEDGKKIYLDGKQMYIDIKDNYNDDILYALNGTFNIITTSKTTKKIILKLYFEYSIKFKLDIIIKILNLDPSFYIDNYDIGDLIYRLSNSSLKCVIENKKRGKNMELCQIPPNYFLTLYKDVFNLPILKDYAECDLKTYSQYLEKFKNDKYFPILFYYKIIGNIFSVIAIKISYFNAILYDDFNDKSIIDKIQYDAPIIYFNKNNCKENINYINENLFTTKDSNATIQLKKKIKNNFIIPKIKNFDSKNYTYGNYLYVFEELEKIKSEIVNSFK